MAIKVGSIVNHTSALEWGAGKVLEISATLAMIQFSDGKNRKIAVSHFENLQPAPPGSFTAPPEVPLIAAPKVARKKKTTKTPIA